jgi:hypothetical protein
MKCLLPGCEKTITENGAGRPSEFCCDAHRMAFHRLIARLVKLIVRDLAACPLVGSRAALPRPVVPSPQPLPGATPNLRSAGQGAALAAFQNWPEDD